MSGVPIVERESLPSPGWRPAFDKNARDYYQYIIESGTVPQSMAQGFDAYAGPVLDIENPPPTYRDLLSIIISNSQLDPREGWANFNEQASEESTQNVTGYFISWRASTIVSELNRRNCLQEHEKTWLAENPEQVGLKLVKLIAMKLVTDQDEEGENHPDYREIVQFALIQSRRETMVQKLINSITLHSINDMELAEQLCGEAHPNAQSIFNFEDDIFGKIARNRRLIREISNHVYRKTPEETKQAQYDRSATALRVFLYTKHLAGNNRESHMDILRKLGIQTDFVDFDLVHQLDPTHTYASRTCRENFAEYIGLHFAEMNHTHFRERI